MNDIDLVLTEMKTVVKGVTVTHPLGDRVWIHPLEAEAIEHATLPFAVISKMNTGEGSWDQHSFGTGMHRWDVLVAVYLAEGPLVVTDPSPGVLDALRHSQEWYKAMADQLMANLTLNGTIDILGDGDGKVYDYITDNIIWAGQFFWGHLFSVPVLQTVVQETSA
jgi:hypothetical protein